jgi:hypothetical protein
VIKQMREKETTSINKRMEKRMFDRWKLKDFAPSDCDRGSHPVR